MSLTVKKMSRIIIDTDKIIRIEKLQELFLYVDIKGMLRTLSVEDVSMLPNV